MEKRKFHRIRFSARCTLTHNGITYHGHTENLSLNGALISFTDGIIVPKGEECAVLVFLEDDETPLRLSVEVVYSFFTMLGTRFLQMDAETQARLVRLVGRFTTEPEKLKEEIGRIQQYLSSYFADGSSEDSKGAASSSIE